MVALFFAVPGPSGMKNARSWVGEVGRRVNFAQVHAAAQERVALAVCGARSDAFVEQLAQAGAVRVGSLLVARTLDEIALPAGALVRAVVYCPEGDAGNGALARVADLPYAVFVVHLNAALPGHSRPASSSSRERPALGRAVSYGVNAYELAQFRKHLLPDIARIYSDHETALAASIPAFRPVVAAKLTADCAMTCLKIAAASAIADHIPVLGLVTGGIASAGDTIAITALQMRMLLRIAAAYGKKPEMARIVELLPVIGGGYGWRTLAREASGFIPIAGIPIKAGIAYAGTLVVGQIAAYYYETGLHMPRNAIGALYREAGDRARGFAQQFMPGRSDKRKP
jgi:uncharacterized protein (DUF697 family)